MQIICIYTFVWIHKFRLISAKQEFNLTKSFFRDIVQLMHTMS